MNSICTLIVNKCQGKKGFLKKLSNPWSYRLVNVYIDYKWVEIKNLNCLVPTTKRGEFVDWMEMRYIVDKIFVRRNEVSWPAIKLTDTVKITLSYNFRLLIFILRSLWEPAISVRNMLNEKERSGLCSTVYSSRSAGVGENKRTWIQLLTGSNPVIWLPVPLSEYAGTQDMLSMKRSESPYVDRQGFPERQMKAEWPSSLNESLLQNFKSSTTSVHLISSSVDFLGNQEETIWWRLNEIGKAYQWPFLELCIPWIN